MLPSDHPHVDPSIQPIHSLGVPESADLRTWVGLTNQALAQLLQWWTPLTTLDLRGCRQVTRLPQDAVVTCPKLASVLLDPERMVSPPPEVCATGADAIARFLRAIAAGDNVTCNIVKLVTVGGPFEGKSSLVDLLRRV